MCCAGCASEIHESSRFCPACGAPVAISLQAATEADVEARAIVPAVGEREDDASAGARTPGGGGG